MKATKAKAARDRLVHFAALRLRRRRKDGLRPTATAEDVAHAGIVAQLEAERNGLPFPLSYRNKAMNDEIVSSASVAEVSGEMWKGHSRVLRLASHPNTPYSQDDMKKASRFLRLFKKSEPSKAIAEEVQEEDCNEAPLLSAIVKRLEEGLSYRERHILYFRYGLKDDLEYTLEDAARIFKISRERVRQIEVEALRKLGTSLRSLVD